MQKVVETEQSRGVFRGSIGNESWSLVNILRNTEKGEKVGGAGLGQKMLNVRNRKFIRRGRSEAKESDCSSHDEDGSPSLSPGWCDKKLCWYQPRLESLPLDFCNNTSLHGLKYLGQSKRHLTERIFWFLAFLVGCFAAVFLISDVWRRYKDSPVIVSFEPEETNIDQIPFPAITICNMNKAQKSMADGYVKNSTTKVDPEVISPAEKNLFYLDHVCSSSKSFTNRFNFSSRWNLNVTQIQQIADAIDKEASRNQSVSEVRSFLRNTSQPCMEMIRHCTWKDKIINCTKIFRPIETDFGKCCTFNMVPQTLLHIFRNDDRDDPEELELWKKANLEEPETSDYDQDQGRPRRQNQAGKSFGLSILLDPDLKEYFCTSSDSAGFRLATHLSTETPHVIDYGVAVMPSAEVFLSIRPEVTKADATIHGYPLDTRKCYFPNEYKLTYYQYYTPSNCLDECVAEFIYQRCQCLRYYMPRNPQDDSRRLCGPTNFTCTETAKGVLADVGLKRNCSHCLPSCSEITYFGEMTTAPLQTDNNWSPNNSFSIVHIYFGQDSTYARIRKELYGTTDLFANTGGLMGLCLGFSGLSAMEVIYFLTLRAWCRKRRKRTIGAKVAAKFRDIWIKVKGVRKYGSRGSGVPSDGDFSGNGQRVFSRTHQLGLIPNLQSPQPVGVALKEPQDGTLPTYNSIIEEISPFYTQRYWNSQANGMKR